MASQTLRPEILVIGAGPGGSAASAGLAEAGHDVLMVDSASFPRDKTCGDGLTPMAVRTLDRLGLLQQIGDAGAQRISTTQITSPLGIKTWMPFANYQAEYPYAMVLQRLVLDDLLRRHAVACGATFVGNTHVTGMMLERDCITAVEASTPGGSLVIRPQHVVIAVGASTGLMKRSGLLRHKPRFIRAARAYYTHTATGQSLYDFYFDMELLPGYGWIFPVSERRANVGIGVLPLPFISPRRSTRTLLEEFVQRRSASGLLPDVVLDGPVKGYPLRIDFPAQRTAGRNWAIVGEAAGLVNPVTGEGIDLALESGLLAARILHENILGRRPDHLAYQRELWERFGPMFNGLRALRDIMILPVFNDYALWLMRQHRFLTRTTMRVAQGLEPPQNVFHPLFVLQFFLPVAPQYAVEQIRRWADHRNQGALN
jgi:geranylgeranyl reductase family protein